MFFPLIFLSVFLCTYTMAFPEPVYHPGDFKLIKPTYKPQQLPILIHPTYNPKYPTKYIRLRRHADGNDPTTKRPGWEVQPDLSRDGKGNTKGRVVLENHGKDHDFEAGWGQTIRGPDKHSETWHVGGSYRW
ncbi:acaloleptin A-like [Anthonomus grandis grandis]|uniref:acaloleptin A-like n=1 Tax=Anthonomus grandis grandis TaxID=2921223 RepID=UPI00216665FE|nr:acaloleptin A-like [Anthonomus grandis grandis]